MRITPFSHRFLPTAADSHFVAASVVAASVMAAIPADVAVVSAAVAGVVFCSSSYWSFCSFPI